MVAAGRQIYTPCQAPERVALNPNRQALRAPMVVLRGPAMGTRNINSLERSRSYNISLAIIYNNERYIRVLYIFIDINEFFKFS